MVQPLAQGLRVAVLSNVGGPAVLAVDACASNGLQVPEFTAELQAQIVDLCPRNGGASNPIDLGAEANAHTYEKVLDLLLASDEVDAVLANFTPPLVNRRTDEVAAAIVAAVDRAAVAADASALDARPRLAKPVVVSLLGAEESAQALESGQAVLRSARYPVPSYTYPETAVRALAHALRYAAWRSRPSGTLPILADVDVNQARRRLPHQEVDRAEAGLAPGWVTGTAAMDVLTAFGVPVVRTVEAHSTEEAGKWADESGARWLSRSLARCTRPRVGECASAWSAMTRLWLLTVPWSTPLAKR